MKKIKLFIVFGLIALLAFVTSCVKKPLEITLVFEDNTVYDTLFCLPEQNLELPTPTKEGHTFDGWYYNDTKLSGQSNFSSDATLVGKFIVNNYTYKFYVGEEVVKEETLPYGSTIVYPTTTPEKEATDSETYTFIGWSNDATTLTKDEVFYAQFESADRLYTYIFLDEEGNEIKKVEAKAGSAIEYPNDLSKEGNAQYDYVFKGWNHNDETLWSNITFEPVFEEVIKQYTYKFVTEEGTVLKEETVDYGTMPIEPTNVTKEGYVFIGWDKDISKVIENVTYVAQFEEYTLTLEGKKLSILGDSISTFYSAGSEVNSYYSDTNTFYYPIYSSTIKTVDLTWWYKLVKNTNMTFGINNSWSGSCAYGNSNSAGMSDARINTINENGQTDIVIIYLGTNDAVNGFTVEQFNQAITTMITKLKAKGVKDIFLTTLGYSDYTGYSYSDETRLAYNAELRNIAQSEGCGIIPLDEYVVNDNYMIYLGDKLHYNAKGAQLLSKVAEKAMKEYYGLEFNEEIDVEHKEILPEGVLGYLTATSNGNFWAEYETEVLFGTSTYTNPQFSRRYLISKNSDGSYYVSNIYKSGDTGPFNCEYVIVISDSHKDLGALLMALENVVVGSIVEFDASLAFPLEITFKEGSQAPSTPENPEPKPEEPTVPEGQIHVGAYNTGIWTLYESTVIAYSQANIDKNSTFVNFNCIKIKKDANSDNYIVTELKPVNQNAQFDDCDYYIFIFSTLEEVSFYNQVKIGDKIAIHGDITSGNANLELL